MITADSNCLLGNKAAQRMRGSDTSPGLQVVFCLLPVAYSALLASADGGGTGRPEFFSEYGVGEGWGRGGGGRGRGEGSWREGFNSMLNIP